MRDALNVNPPASCAPLPLSAWAVWVVFWWTGDVDHHALNHISLVIPKLMAQWYLNANCVPQSAWDVEMQLIIVLSVFGANTFKITPAQATVQMGSISIKMLMNATNARIHVWPAHPTPSVPPASSHHKYSTMGSAYRSVPMAPMNSTNNAYNVQSHANCANSTITPQRLCARSVR